MVDTCTSGVVVVAQLLRVHRPDLGGLSPKAWLQFPVPLENFSPSEFRRM